MVLRLDNITVVNIAKVAASKDKVTYWYDFVDVNGDLTRIEVSIKGEYSPFEGRSMDDRWLKESQTLKLTKVFKDLHQPNYR